MPPPKYFVVPLLQGFDVLRQASDGFGYFGELRRLLRSDHARLAAFNDCAKISAHYF
jgi:hypothetical protein